MKIAEKMQEVMMIDDQENVVMVNAEKGYTFQVKMRKVLGK